MISGLVKKKTNCDAEFGQIKSKISNITGLATTTQFNDVKNKILNVSILVRN